MMFYFAIALIAAGLLLMFFIFLSASETGSREAAAGYGAPMPASSQEVHPAPSSPGPEQSRPEREYRRQERTAPPPRKHSPSVRFQWVDSARKEPAVRDSEQLIAGGVLFLDHGRQIHLNAGRFEKLDSSSFVNLKRVGSADLKASPEGFTIHCGRASYRFSSESLEQILFLNGGIALVPSSRSEAVVVFLTESTDRIREFIKKYSRMPSEV